MDHTEAGRTDFDGGGLYVHVPYCRKKCIYCDFYSAGERFADWHRYVDALCSEFRHRIDELAWPLRTVYFGGGTPSLMPEDEFIRLCGFLYPYESMVEEFTIEVNPDDVDGHMLEVWKKCGVNRLSMGIQTFDDKALTSIRRRHDSSVALDSYRLARNVFGNISIDLMFGLPGQTPEMWLNDIKTALELRPEHISAYSLMYEDGTALTALRDCGRIEEAPESVNEEMFLMLVEELSNAGYDHYEISNFALPGFRSRHNSSYWLQKPYIGLGPSSHSYDGEKLRYANRADIRAYLDYWMPLNLHASASGIPPAEKEYLSDVEQIEEYVLTRLRMREGIPIEDFKARFGEEYYLKLVSKAHQMVDNSLIEVSDTNISLSEKSLMICDSIILELASII